MTENRAFTTVEKMEILFQDEAIVVANKPGGMLAVPGRGPEKADCLAARLRTLFPTMIGQPAVHRLDMATSGLMVFAMTSEAHRRLSMAFAARQVEKRYIALVAGHLSQGNGEIRLAFRLDPNNRPLQVYDPVAGKQGITRWQKIAVEQECTRLLLTPLTGRTHQLRLHTSHPLGLGTPIVGDSLYGSGKVGDRMCLHAGYLAFSHPQSREILEFASEPPF